MVYGCFLHSAFCAAQDRTKGTLVVVSVKPISPRLRLLLSETRDQEKFRNGARSFKEQQKWATALRMDLLSKRLPEVATTGDASGSTARGDRTSAGAADARANDHRCEQSDTNSSCTRKPEETWSISELETSPRRSRVTRMSVDDTVNAIEILVTWLLRDEAERKRHCALALFEMKGVHRRLFHERHVSERQTMSCEATCLRQSVFRHAFVQVAVSESLSESEVQTLDRQACEHAKREQRECSCSQCRSPMSQGPRACMTILVGKWTMVLKG